MNECESEVNTEVSPEEAQSSKYKLANRQHVLDIIADDALVMLTVRMTLLNK